MPEESNGFAGDASRATLLSVVCPSYGSSGLMVRKASVNEVSQS